MTGSGPASTLSVDSEAYSTPLSSLSGQDGGTHRSLVQQTDASDSDVILKLQEDNKTKATTIRKLQQEVNQLQQRLKYAEQLEEQILRLTTEESEHEQEKQLMKAEIQKLQRTASVSRPYTRSYAHEQKLQELAKRYEQQYNEELEENSMLREKISYLEREMQELEGGTTYIGEVDDSDLKVKLKQKEQHIQTLQTQVESLQQHSKGQSRQVLQLKQELEALKVRKLIYTIQGVCTYVPLQPLLIAFKGDAEHFNACISSSLNCIPRCSQNLECYNLSLAKNPLHVRVQCLLAKSFIIRNKLHPQGRN